MGRLRLQTKGELLQEMTIYVEATRTRTQDRQKGQVQVREGGQCFLVPSETAGKPHKVLPDDSLRLQRL